jgi:hypothetical protein
MGWSHCSIWIQASGSAKPALYRVPDEHVRSVPTRRSVANNIWEELLSLYKDLKILMPYSLLCDLSAYPLMQLFVALVECFPSILHCLHNLLTALLCIPYLQ